MSNKRKRDQQPRAPIDKQQAFLEFKSLDSESGPEHEQTIRQCR